MFFYELEKISGLKKVFKSLKERKDVLENTTIIPLEVK
jgi:hypothetical protein